MNMRHCETVTAPSEHTLTLERTVRASEQPEHAGEGVTGVWAYVTRVIAEGLFDSEEFFGSRRPKSGEEILDREC